jgi:acylphosphatase
MRQVARRVRVTGLVQGVFFRAWTREQAQALGVKGWVRNCRDGSVEAHVEGEERAVEQLLAKMRQGPPAAQVAELTAEEVEPEGFDHFDVAMRL